MNFPEYQERRHQSASALPCPCCGAEYVMEVERYMVEKGLYCGDLLDIRIYCWKCGMTTPELLRSRATALETWNTRPKAGLVIPTTPPITASLDGA